MDDVISRQGFDKFLEDAEKEAVKNRKYVFASALNTIRGNLRNFPSAQPDLDEWCTTCFEYDSERHCCPRFNRVIRETLKEMKDVQPEIIRCKDCKHFAGEGMYCANDIIVQYDHFYCYDGERREE